METFAPYSSKDKAIEQLNHLMESPFRPQDLKNYIIGHESGEVLQDGRIVCGQHVFKAESLDDGITYMECKWYAQKI